MTELEIVFDTREKELIRFFQENHSDLPVNVEQLPVGDIVVKNTYSTVTIERKTIVDMLASIKDGRYKEQKERLKTCDIKLYIIENDTIFTKNKILSGAYFNTMLRDKISIIYTNCIQQTAEFIAILYETLFNKPDRFVQNTNKDYVECLKTKTKKIENIDKRTCFIMQLSQIPLISTKIAKNIAAIHPNMNDFLTTLKEWEEPVKYLVTIPNVGTNKAQKIIEYLL